MTLVCVRCSKRATFPADAKHPSGVTLLEWYISRGSLCTACFEQAGGVMPGRVHHQAHDTELAAAQAVKYSAATLRARVVDALRELQTQGSTDYEMGVRLGAKSHSCGTRREELADLGWPILDSGERRPTDTGCPAIVWVLRGEQDRTASKRPASKMARRVAALEHALAEIAPDHTLLKEVS